MNKKDHWIFTERATVAELLGLLIEDHACYDALRFVQKRLDATLPDLIALVRNGCPNYSKWLNDNGYVFTWEKAEETYCRGERFAIDGSPGKYLLAQVGMDAMVLVDLREGNRYEESIVVGLVTKVTRDEMLRMTGGNTFSRIG